MIVERIKELGETYHDRLVGSNLVMSGQVCDCCKKETMSTWGIEHDSQDHSKDLGLCDDCFMEILKYWVEFRPRKIAPI